MVITKEQRDENLKTMLAHLKRKCNRSGNTAIPYTYEKLAQVFQITYGQVRSRLDALEHAGCITRESNKLLRVHV